MIKHLLNFVSSGHGIIEIEEPVGFDGVEFLLQQAEKREGRDISGITGSKMKLYSLPDHCLDIMLYNVDQFGFEAVVKYILEFNGVRTVVGDIDFSTLTTDDITYVDFIVIDEAERLILKRRTDVATNIFNTLTLDNTPILSVQTYGVLIPAKPIVQVSEWKTPTNGGISQTTVGLGGEGSVRVKYFNFAIENISSEIEDSLSYIPANRPAHDFAYLEAKNNLKNLTVTISDLSYQLLSQGNGTGTFLLFWFIGNDDQLNDGILDGNNLIATGMPNDREINVVDSSFTFTIDATRGKKLYIYFATDAYAGSNNDSYTIRSFVKTMNVKITASSQTYNSVVPMVRLIDAMRYNIKSASGLDIKAPKWEPGGEYYNQFITTQALMRNLIDKPFNLSNKNIVEDYLQPECNGDYQLMRDNTVFFGKEPDYYRDIEIANFEQQYDDHGQIEGFEKSNNERYKVNVITFSNKNFASEKENTTENTYDIVHGSYKGLLPNKHVQNSKDVEVGWVRDAFLWETSRRRAIDLSDTTATQDDDKIFIADIVDLIFRDFTETSLLKHTFAAGILTLTNDKSFNWAVLGLAVNDTFTITTGPNAGIYTINTVGKFDLKLNAPDGVLVEGASTTYSYRIGSDVVYKARTNEGFADIQNLNDGDKYINLMYTTKRNVLNNYSRYLATCMMYRPDEYIKQTEYKNNALCSTRTTLESQNIIEGADIQVSNPTLTPLLIKCNLVMTLSEFFAIENEIRSYDESGLPKSGYIRTFDTNGLPIKGYPQKMSWTFLSKAEDINDLVGICDTILEEKHTPFYMVITGSEGTITINNEITPSDFTYEIDGFGKLLIFDEVGKLLHLPVPFDRVKVNNTEAAISVIDLAQRLESLM
jgi:hypothetical protein